MSYIRSFQSLHFPWRFNDRTPFMLLPLSDTLNNDLQAFKQGFITAFKETLIALEENDSDFLKEIMEPKLFSEVISGLDTLKRREHNLKRTNPDQFVYAYFYNDRIYRGVNLDRSLNNDKELTERQMYDIDIKIRRNKEPRMNVQNLLKFEGKDGHLTNNLIFKIDVVYNTATKLIVLDENGERIIGEQNKSPETHKFRFETMTTIPDGYLNDMMIKVQLPMYYLYGYGVNPFKDSDWIITDIDDHLKGNPFSEEIHDK